MYRPAWSPKPEQSQPSEACLIELQSVSKSFGGVKVVQDVTLGIAAGERIALLGENGAGKSTVASLLSGIYTPSAGKLLVDGKPVKLNGAADARRLGIAIVQQHATLLDSLSVFENCTLSMPAGILTARKSNIFRADILKIFKELGFSIPLDALAGTLSPATRQALEIAKAALCAKRLLILDEPTSMLGPEDARRLALAMTAFSARGVSVLLITHKLHDAVTMCQRACVLKSGKLVLDAPVAATTENALAEAMVGKALELQHSAKTLTVRPIQSQSIVFEVVNARAGRMKDMTLGIGSGEIVGVAAVDGSGQRELGRSIAGLVPLSGGKLRFRGKAVTQWTPRKARAAGIAFLGDERMESGMWRGLTFAEHVGIGSSTFFRNHSTEHQLARRVVDRGDVMPARTDLRAGDYSGGNQQRFYVSWQLPDKPALVVAQQPTRGLDFSAALRVREQLHLAAQSGAGVLLISSDLDELFELSTRLIVCFEGRIVAEFSQPPFERAAVGRAMTGASS